MNDITLDVKTHISFPDLPGYEDIISGIESGSVSLEEVLFNNGIVFGECNSNKFEATIYNLPDVSSQRIIAWQESPSLGRIPLFKGLVDSAVQDNQQLYRKIVAYDDLYTKGSMDAAGWWDTFWSSITQTKKVTIIDNDGNETVKDIKYTTLKVLRDNLLDFFEIDYVDTTLLNDDLEIYNMQDYSSVTVLDLLKAIGELQCAMANMNREGVLEWITLATDSSTAVELQGLFDTNTAEFESYTTAEIAKVQIFNDTQELVGIAGAGDNAYSITNNILIYERDQNFYNSLAEAVYNEIKNIQYNPLNIEMLKSDMTLGLGSYIHTSKGYSYIFSNYFSNVLLVDQHIESYGDEYLVDSYSTLSPEIKKLIAKTKSILDTLKTDYLTAFTIESKYLSVDNLVANVAKINSLTANDAIIKNIYSNSIVSDKGVINVLQSNLITADLIQAITLDVEEAIVGELDVQYAKIDFANVTTEAVEKLFVNVGILENAVITEGKITGTLSGVRVVADVIEANTIVAGDLIVKSSDDNEVYYKINVSESGTTEEELKSCEYDKYVSGQDIVAKSITANQIAANSITGNEIMSKSITGNNIAANTITANEIESNTITADKLSVSLIEAISNSPSSAALYQLEEKPTLDNYPANEWYKLYYPPVDDESAEDYHFPGDFTWVYDYDSYIEHQNSLAIIGDKVYRFKYVPEKDWFDWIEEENTEASFLLKSNAQMRLDLNQFKLEISADIGTLAGEVTKVSAELELTVKKTDNNQIISMINESADEINITAKNGGVNIKGNKFSMESTNTKITEDGTMECKNFIMTGGALDMTAEDELVVNKIRQTTSHLLYTADHIEPPYGEHPAYKSTYAIEISPQSPFSTPRYEYQLRSYQAIDDVITGYFYYLDYTGCKFNVSVYNSAGGVVFTSDKNKKNSIEYLEIEDTSNFIYSLKPCKFKYNNGTSGRYHHGLIAQDVEEAMGEDDWGLYCEYTDEATGETTKALRYDELIADLIATVQSQNKRIEELEKIVNNKK